MKTLRAALIATALGIAFVSTATLRASHPVSNMGQPTSGSTFAIGKSVPAFDFQTGMSFTTGAGLFELNEISLEFYSRNGAATGFTTALYSDLTAAGPSGLVTMLSGNTEPSTGLETYVPTNPTTLLGGTTYWLVAASPSTPALTGFSLMGTNSLLEDAGALPGWSIGDFRMVSNNGGASWFSASPTSGVLHMSVLASPVPDGGITALMLAIPLTFAAVLRRKR